ncbi:TNF/TNFR- and CUB-domains protein [Lymphocystis disease virus 1]|uniref:TNF/TNFR- and CUB-domains protein n=1 Tax=Fish lymphocystis disease virus TaxID=36363 RepID=UPI0000161EC4|nr:TNF/TNFR- and CUB-domains protein [Lymphocystis disease virus 1]
MMQGYSQNCKDLTTKWDPDLSRCIPCDIPPAGRNLNPNCGYDDDGGRHDVRSAPCAKGTYNTGHYYYCKPCTTCPQGDQQIACSSSANTQCSPPTTVAAATTTTTALTTYTPAMNHSMNANYSLGFNVPIELNALWGLATLFTLLRFPTNRTTYKEQFHCGGDTGSINGDFTLNSNFEEYNCNCSYTVTLKNTSAMITFLFYTIDLVNNCTEEYVELVDGTTQSSLGKFCGDKLPGPIDTTGPELLVNFISKKSSNSTGFLGGIYEL